VAHDTVSILEGGTFVVSRGNGDIVPSSDQAYGLFERDTRFLSEWRLTMDGQPLTALSTDDLLYFKAQFFLVPGGGDVYTNATVTVVRQRAVGEGFHEDLTVLNSGSQTVEIELRIDADADFADLFEVKDALAKKGRSYRRVEAGRLVLGYERETFVRETWITASAREVSFDGRGLVFRIHLEPQAEWTTCIEVATALGPGARPPGARHPHGDDQPRPHMSASLDEWIGVAPALTSSWTPLEQIYLRSLVDLAALRYFPPTNPSDAVPAAGLPWFMTLFGRDSIITSFQALPFQPELAATTLRVLGNRQGNRVDNFRDEEPGKILHEMRQGELTAFEERPHSPYFGTADATPLYLVLLDEYERWTEDRALVRELEPVARRALAWIDEYGDRDGDGYVEYERRNAVSGLENQCWKDSWDSILWPDGSLAELPRATCEIQGYVYDAKRRCARLARDVWGDDELAVRLEREAGELKQRFNEDYWVEDGGFYALALDGRKRPVPTLTSNIGHLLWSGIVDDERAAAVVGHLLGERLFSGWGVRTMATGCGGYNPIGYHTGTVWPHDNALIALGLTRYGFRAEAAKVAFALLWAAGMYFHDRLPEAFAGYERERTHFPVEYPTACSPQAWATGAPLVFLRTMLGLEPRGARLKVDPHLPDEISWIELAEIRGPWGAASAVAGEPPAQNVRDAVSLTVRRPKELSVPRAAWQAHQAPAPVSRPVEGPESAAELFEWIAAHPGGGWPVARSGIVAFDVDGAGSWRLTVENGLVTVGRGGDGAPDATYELAEPLLLAIARGERNGIAAYLRGQIVIRGDRGIADEARRYLAGLVATA